MRRYHVLDVFTDTPGNGNPLAVVLNAEGLGVAEMQAIAREFNFSETVFVFPALAPRHRAQFRIFTPAYELSFAGHPIVGAASLLALLERGPTVDSAFGVEIAAGDVPCVVERINDVCAFVRFRAPLRPSIAEGALNRDAAAAALGLESGEIGLNRHDVRRATAGGSTFQCIPVSNLETLARAHPSEAFARLLGSDLAYVYAAASDADEAHWRARMFAPQAGVPEDPATGSAAASFAAALMAAEAFGDGVHDIVIVQGVEMGRPSRIALQLNVMQGRLDHVEIGGRAVMVSEGVLGV